MPNDGATLSDQVMGQKGRGRLSSGPAGLILDFSPALFSLGKWGQHGKEVIAVASVLSPYWVSVWKMSWCCILWRGPGGEGDGDKDKLRRSRGLSSLSRR